MAIVTATQITSYTDISASAGTITASGLIPIVQERINYLTNNYFVSDRIYYQGNINFNATDYTMTASSNLEEIGFLSGDELYLYGSYRNDGYCNAESISAETITIASSKSVIVEQPSGASILISLVKWPEAIKYVAAQMVKYDYDDRAAAAVDVVSETLGPHSITYNRGESVKGSWGYPKALLDSLAPYTIARLM